MRFNTIIDITPDSLVDGFVYDMADAEVPEFMLIMSREFDSEHMIKAIRREIYGEDFEAIAGWFKDISDNLQRSV